MGLVIYIDGGARGNPGPAGAGVTIRNDYDELLFEAGYFLGRQTNNAAEYHALIRALQRAQDFAEQPLTVFSDSELLVRQITGDYQVKSPTLAQLYQQVQFLLLRVRTWSVRHVKREENKRADELANIAMDQQRDVVVFDAHRPAHSDEVPGANAAREAGDECESGGAAPSEAGLRPAEPAADGEPRPPTEAQTPRAVHVVVHSPPNTEACPAGGLPAADFTVSTMLPADFCVHAAHAILPTLLAMLNTEPQEFAAVPTLTVRCNQGCGAVFHLSPVRSPNGS